MTQVCIREVASHKLYPLGKSVFHPRRIHDEMKIKKNGKVIKKERRRKKDKSINQEPKDHKSFVHLRYE